MAPSKKEKGFTPQEENDIAAYAERMAQSQASGDGLEWSSLGRSEQDRRIQQARVNMTSNDIQNARMEASGLRKRAQDVVAQSGVDVPVLAEGYMSGQMSGATKTVIGQSGTRAAVRPLMATEVKRAIGQYDAEKAGLDWNKLSKEERQNYAKKAYFDFDAAEANTLWKDNQKRNMTLQNIASITNRVQLLQSMASS